jgi:hypothetical protein
MLRHFAFNLVFISYNLPIIFFLYLTHVFKMVIKLFALPVHLILSLHPSHNLFVTVDSLFMA